MAEFDPALDASGFSTQSGYVLKRKSPCFALCSRNQFREHQSGMKNIGIISLRQYAFGALWQEFRKKFLAVLTSKWQLQDCKTANFAFRADIWVYYWCKPTAKIAFCLIGGSVQREAEIACFPVEKYKVDTLIAKIQYPQGE